jgi:hypothetical protein
MAVVIDPGNDILYEDLGSMVLAGILILVGILFAWIAKETQRGTSASLAYAFIAQIGSVPRLYEVELLGDWSLLVIFFMLVGPALVIYAFLKSDIPPTFELVGYGAAFSAAMLILASVSDLPVALGFDEYIILLFAAFGAMLCLGVASYLFGRWRETKQTPTLLYMIAFGAFYLGQMMGIFGSTGVVPDPTGILLLFDFFFAGTALTLLATAAILATGRGSVSLIPFVLLVPVITVMWLGFEGSVGDLFFENILIVIPALIAMLLPIPIFLAVWWRMRAAGSASSGRPLGLAVGIILFFLARMPPLFLGLPGLDFGYGVVALSFFVSWLAVTGRLNRSPKTQ